MIIPTLLGITFITFLLLSALPGDPVRGMAGNRSDPETLARMRRELGTDQHFIRRYAGYLKLLSRGEMGRSYYTQKKVSREIAEKLPNTLKLACAAMLVSTVFGLVLGSLMAVYRGRLLDRICLIISTGGISVPVFWVGLVLIYIFAFQLKLLPPSGTGGAAMVLPACTLGLYSAAFIARITRAGMIETLGQPFILTARAKGVGATAVVIRHALKNTLIPVVTLVGLDFGSYLNGSVLTETIFGWNGIGRYAVEGIFRRDYPVILGSVLVGAGLFVAVNLIVDLLYGLFDPRIGAKKGGG